jgi:hypothetical protein
MPKSTGHVPAYRLHKPSGQARVIINREHIYLGKFGSSESRDKYVRLIAELNSAAGEGLRGPRTAKSPLTINEVILAYWQFAKAHYSKGGKPTKELTCMREALRPLRQLYGSVPAREFGPKALKAIRQHLTGANAACGCRK